MNRYDDDLRRAERFYSKSYPYATQPGAASAQQNAGMFYCATSTLAYGNVKFPVDMCGAPTVRLFDPTNGGASGTGFSGSATVSGLTPNYIGEKGFSLIQGSGLTPGNMLFVGWDASKEI